MRRTVGGRALLNRLLSLAVADCDVGAIEFAAAQVQSKYDPVTRGHCGFKSLRSPGTHTALQHFHDRWREYPLVLGKMVYDGGNFSCIRNY